MNIYVNIYIYIYLHTHTYVYIYMLWTCVRAWSQRPPPTRNSSQMHTPTGSSPSSSRCVKALGCQRSLSSSQSPNTISQPTCAGHRARTCTCACERARAEAQTHALAVEGCKQAAAGLGRRGRACVGVVAEGLRCCAARVNIVCAHTHKRTHAPHPQTRTSTFDL